VKPSGYFRRILATAAIVLLMIGAALFFLRTVDVFFLVFAGVLGAVFLRAPTTWLSARLKINQKLTLLITLVSVLAAVTMIFLIFGPKVVNEGQTLISIMPRSPSELRAFVEHYDFDGSVLNNIPGVYEDIFRTGERLFRNPKFLFAPIQVFGYLLFIAFITLYFAIDPELYQKGLIHLLPLDKRSQGELLLRRLASSIRWFLLGRFASMLAVGTLTTILLLAFDIPLAVALGIITGTLTFVPYLGPIVSTVPVVLVAVVQSPDNVFLILLLYVGIQLLEGYVLTPVFQKMTVYVPPAMTLIAEILLGIVFGTLGIVMAAPSAAVFLVLYHSVYRESLLGEERVFVGHKK